MKLNKKIVAGLATAALFAPLALNNVQVHANDSSTTGENSSIDKSKDKISQLNQYLTALGASNISSDKFQNVLSNLSQISNSYKDITQNTTNYQKDRFTSLLNDNNKDEQNRFINSFSRDTAQSVVNDISSKFNDSEDIKNERGNYSLGHYKAEQLKQTLTGIDMINANNINDSNVNSIIQNIEDINGYNFGDDDDYISNSSKGHNTNSFISNTSNPGELKSQLSGKIAQINSFKDVSNTPDSYKAEQLKKLFDGDDKVNNGNINDQHVQSILSSIENINSSKSNIENKNNAFEQVLKQKDFDTDTRIHLDAHDVLTIGDRLSTINDIQNHTSSPAQSSVVITRNNNSNSNNTNQSSKPTETNDSHEVQFPSAPKSDNVVKDSHATKVNNAKSDVKKAEKQLANAKSNKAKNNAVKSINKAKANLTKLNGNQKSTLKDAKKSVKKAEKQVKKAKNSDARKSANVSLKAAQTNYTQLNKYIK